MIKPTVGRVVWFHPDESTTNAAIVTRVWSDEMVNLVVFDENSNVQPETSVWLWQGEGATIPKPTSRYCEWMPFQIGQAKRNVEGTFT